MFMCRSHDGLYMVFIDVLLAFDLTGHLTMILLCVCITMYVVVSVARMILFTYYVCISYSFVYKYNGKRSPLSENRPII